MAAQRFRETVRGSLALGLLVAFGCSSPQIAGAPGAESKPAPERPAGSGREIDPGASPGVLPEPSGTLPIPVDAGLPGAPPDPAELRQKLEAALVSRGPGYQPRTEHLVDGGRPRFLNRLILEESPYLLQHAHNPVDWYPWGTEAFEKAKREMKPIFLSIGYSTCHWCHVMERESFEDVEIARRMNEGFVSIKVDREQRPDVDEIYMTAVMVTTGRGGWPMSSFLTPEGHPFYGATYFPPAEFRNLLAKVQEAWKAQRPALEEQARRVSAAVERATAAHGNARALGREAIEAAETGILKSHDPQRGGFGGAPRFPHEPELLFLIQRIHRAGRHDAAIEAVERSLDAMARGGIHDQIGGGFHRYATDDEWLVPHFEKMLYNQAHLARAYLGAYRLTGEARHARVAKQIFDYVLRDMTSASGGFYSATDADSEGEEGRFFVWDPAEIRAILTPEDADRAILLFGVTEAGNFEGRNILNLGGSLEDHARDQKIALSGLLDQVDRIREKLYQVREKRPHPLRDDKILTEWNAMMITALAEAGDLFGEVRYRDAARRAGEFLWQHNRRGPDGLWRVHLNGVSSIPAGQEDHAFLLEALVTLHDVTGEKIWLDRAEEVARGMLERFWDESHGGFFMSEKDGDPHLIARPKSPTDGATPSGNSVAVGALVRLAARTGNPLYRQRAEGTLSAFAAAIERQPPAFSTMLAGADVLLHGEVGPRDHGAGGKVAAAATLRSVAAGKVQLTVEVVMQPGWHINAHDPLQKDLIATGISVDPQKGPWALETIRYPASREVSLSFQTSPLRVFEGRVEIQADLSWKPGAMGRTPILSIGLRFQACDDRSCLAPETMVLEVPVASVGGPGS